MNMVAVGCGCMPGVPLGPQDSLHERKVTNQFLTPITQA